MNNERPIYVGTREAAHLLGISPRTLDRYRISGEGPVFHKFGKRVCYARTDLEDWAAARRAQLDGGRRQRAGRSAPVSGRRTGPAGPANRRERVARIAVLAVVALFLACLGIDLAFATTDTTFDAPLDTVTDMVSGTGGQLAAALAVGAAWWARCSASTPCSSWARSAWASRPAPARAS